VEKHTSISLTENLAMHPAASVCGIYFAHPESSYYNVGTLERDQVADYAERKGMDLATMERWLASRLAYDADDAVDAEELPVSGDGATVTEPETPTA
jgi:5-methyltetrahydrofolate--homocysteine methyltransferase